MRVLPEAGKTQRLQPDFRRPVTEDGKLSKGGVLTELTASQESRNTVSTPVSLPVPQGQDELGIPWSLALDTAIRRIFLDGTSSLSSLTRSLKISFNVAESILQQLRKSQWADVTGSSAADVQFALTERGHTIAANRMQRTQYAGPLPVSLGAYSDVVRAQAGEVELNPGALREALADLVVTEDLLEQLGPAILSQSSLFLHGPTGNGKTSIATRIARVYRDAIFVPHAVEVDGQVISVFDPIIHQAVEQPMEDTDPRWVTCKRPSVVVGGELTPELLDLRVDERTNIYTAPPQMRANNGVLVIDDFGRQAMSPRDLLNRWIVPLDRGEDYLALRHGTKFSIPFDTFVVFATNLKPAELVDDAFFRRIKNKVYLGPCRQEDFDEILRREMEASGLSGPADAGAMLRRLVWKTGAEHLRACYPSDICSILTWIFRYNDLPREITEASLQRAVRLYFSREEV